MKLIMLDIDGTLTQSYEYDQEVFALAIAEVIHCQSVNANLNNYVHKTSLGVTTEAIQRVTGRNPDKAELREVKRRVLGHLENRYKESPGDFCEVPGASRFLEQLREFNGTVTAIATGCWRSEALFKLRASGLSIAGIPLATSDDDQDRLRIMEIAAQRALDLYSCGEFDRIVYIGDGLWDLQNARSLGYGFVGIGSRIKVLKDSGVAHLHEDYSDMEAVIHSIKSELNS